jgi:hypothetical protein
MKMKDKKENRVRNLQKFASEMKWAVLLASPLL